MKCPRCKYEWKLPGPQAGGRARVKKGFASAAVQRKAQATRRRNRAIVRRDRAGSDNARRKQ